MSDFVLAERSAEAELSTRRRLPAWLLSVLLHVVLLVLLGLWFPMEHRGTSVEPARAAGIVLAQHESEKTTYWTPADQVASDASQQATASLSDSLPAAVDVPTDVAGALPLPDALLQDTGSLAAALPDAGSLTQGGGTGQPFSSGQYEVQTGVFGLEAKGSKFVYVFDRSASMQGFGGRPLIAAKSELLASLKSLGDVHQFQIIFYNEQPQVFNPLPGQSPRMMFGDEATKRRAEQFVQSIAATGGTHHLEALRMAIGLQPDVIFFLTDAAEPQLSAGELADIRRRNGGASIHAVEFGAGAKSGQPNFLVKLARENGGQYTYVDVTKLRRRG